MILSTSYSQWHPPWERWPCLRWVSCTGSRAWHPLAPSRVFLRVLRGRINILEYSCCCLCWMCLFREVLGRQLLDVLCPRWLSEGFRSYPPCGRDWQPVHGGFWQNLTFSGCFSCNTCPWYVSWNHAELRSAHSRCSCSHLEIRHYFDEPFVFSSHLFAVRVLPAEL